MGTLFTGEVLESLWPPLALATVDYLAQVCSVNHKLDVSILDEGGVGEEEVNWLLRASSYVKRRRTQN